LGYVIVADDDFFHQDRMRARLSDMFEAINNTVANLAGLC